MKEIQLTKGKTTIVDDEQFEYLSRWRWQCKYDGHNFYATRSGWANGKKYEIKMHREILGINEKSIKCDHIDGDGLNNQKSNLRAVSHGQNMMNKRVSSNSVTGEKGVCMDKRYNSFRATIGVNGKKIYLGCFKSLDMAKEARAKAEKIYHGEFAKVG